MSWQLVVGPVTIKAHELSLLFCLFSSYPLSLLYHAAFHGTHRRTSTWVKNLYLFLVALLFMRLCFSLWTTAYLLAAVLFTYCFAWCFQRAWWMPPANFVLVLLHLASAHLYLQFRPHSPTEQPFLDPTGLLMMLTIKLTSFATDMSSAWFWSRQLRARRLPAPRPQSHSPLEKKKDATAAAPAPSDGDRGKAPYLDPDTKFSALQKYPDLLEFLGYATLFPGLLTGPSVSFYEYRTFVNGSYFAAVEGKEAALRGRKRRALSLLLMAIVALVAYVGLGPAIPHSYLFEAEYMAQPLWYRLAYLHVANIVQRCRYYFAWFIAEGAFVVIGLGFRMDASGRPVWDRLENISPWHIEGTTNFREFVGKWNIYTNQWLNSYVYRRIQTFYGKRNSSIRASIATYLVSAVWHGFYPGYYFTFVTAAWMTIVCRSTPSRPPVELTTPLVIYKNVVWPFDCLSRALLVHVLLHVMIDYTMTPFILLDSGRTIAFWSSFGFFGHGALALATIYFVLVRRLRRKPPKAHSTTSREPIGVRQVSPANKIARE